jgi:hypothetical protein
MGDSCVILEAFRQLLETNALPDVNLATAGQQSLSKAKEMMARLKERRLAESGTTKARTASRTTKAPPPPASGKGKAPPASASASMLYYAESGKLTADKLLIYNEDLRVITQGTDYFSLGLEEAVTLLKTKLPHNVALSSGNGVELREVVAVRYLYNKSNDQRLVEFSLGDTQATDGTPLAGKLADVKLFFGNL